MQLNKGAGNKLKSAMFMIHSEKIQFHICTTYQDIGTSKKWLLIKPSSTQQL